MKKVTLLFVLILVPSTVSADLEKGKTLFQARCASCHGAIGVGDGPIAAGLPPETKPRNLQTGEFKIVTDDAKFKELLSKGGAAFNLSPLMPPQPDLADQDLTSIIEFARSLRVKK